MSRIDDVITAIPTMTEAKCAVWADNASPAALPRAACSSPIAFRP